MFCESSSATLEVDMGSDTVESQGKEGTPPDQRRIFGPPRFPPALPWLKGRS